jgi:membrane-associated phospholipid phosphatase
MSFSIEGGNAASNFNAYDNSKQLRRESSYASLYDHVFVQARSPREIISSFHEDLTLQLATEAFVSFLFFLVGCYMPKVFQHNSFLTIRPIPYQVTQAGDVIQDLTLANELVAKSDATFSGPKLWFLSLWVPFFVIVILGGIFPLVVSTLPNNTPFHNVHAGVCTILVAIGLSELITQTFKLYVGRLRPNFYSMCGFNTETLSCDNGEEMEMEARMSFPSGHSSLSFCGMMTLTLFCLGRVGLGRSIIPKTSSAKGKFLLILSFTPLLLSCWVATSRLVDNWHHPSDIVAGCALGIGTGFMSYHLWFPHVFSPISGVPVSVQIIDATPDRESDSHMTLEKSQSLPIYSLA